MSFFVITEGYSEIQEIFAGETKEEVVQAARKMINLWPEYEALSDEEVIELAENGHLEFDLVEIPETYRATLSKEDLIQLYQKHYS